MNRTDICYSSQIVYRNYRSIELAMVMLTVCFLTIGWGTYATSK